jgi:hypothetical protein
MKLRITTMMLRVTFFTALASTSVLAAATVPNDLMPGWDALQQAEIKSDVSYLASDQLQGRLTFQKGDERAVKWIADEFKKIGLKPVVGDSYLQAVPLIEYVPNKKRSYLSFTSKADKKKWQEPNVYSNFYKNINIVGDVVFAGYGITAPELNYDDYKNIDVRGKTVLIFEHEPQETDNQSIFNGTANTRFATNRVKALNAQAHGAVAVLIMPEPNRKHPSNQERHARIGGADKRKVKVPSFVLENDELQIPIAILSDKAAKQIAGKALSLSKLQTEIDKDLKPRSQLIPDVQVALHDQIKSSKVGVTYNVVGLLEGSDPTLNAETVIISAHHDHDGKSGNQVWHGADDNASGTAGVIEMARAMVTNNNAKAGLKVNRSVLFVVFAAEERGLLGAFYMAAHPLRPLATTRAMLNFDMIGRNEKRSLQTDGLIKIPAETNNRLNLIGSHYSPDYHAVVVQQNKLVGLELDNRFDNENALNVFFRSDQFPFILHNVPAFWWFTGFHPDYHHVSDTADKINYAKMQKILRLAYLSAYVFANGANTPKFIENPGLNT